MMAQVMMMTQTMMMMKTASLALMMYLASRLEEAVHEQREGVCAASKPESPSHLPHSTRA
jgi:hypothetical protein